MGSIVVFYFYYDYYFFKVHHKEIAAKCTLNANDMSGTGDQPMSRRKSFKKSFILSTFLLIIVMH